MSTVSTPPRQTTDLRVQPCRDDEQLRAYIDEYWRRGHVLATNPDMFNFTYRTPWVDRDRFPHGTSALCIYDDDGEVGEPGRLLGFLGTINAPYPRPQSYWLALWHVLPELKGTGLGGQLLRTMQAYAEEADGWIGTFGAGPEAVPVYLKRGYAVRAVRRWVYEPETAESRPAARAVPFHSAEHTPDADWLAYRYERHPVYDYESTPAGVFRTEANDWGIVTHCCRLTGAQSGAIEEVARRGQADARAVGVPYLMDAWSFDAPGPEWKLAPEDLPSVFHPPRRAAT